MGKMYILDNVINNKTGQIEGFCIIKSITEKTDKNGKMYLDLELFDAGGSIAAKLWDYNPDIHKGYEPDMIIKIRATVNVFRDTEQLRIDMIRMSTDSDVIDMTKLLPVAPFDSQFMFDELYKCTEAFENNEIKKLVQYMMNENKENLLNWPAALKLHHAMRGGLLYHTYTMYRVAKGICEIYPMLRTDLVYGGIILHDLAKIDELCANRLGLSTGYSTCGQLIGHIPLGVAKIEVAAQKLEISNEIKIAFQHIILSHHSSPEFGSPKYPMFPEAEVVATVDNLDARMYEMFDVLDGVNSGGFSDRQWALDNRLLYKVDY